MAPLAFGAKGVYNSRVAEQAWLIPGRPAAPGVPLARYRPVQSVGAVGAYVRDLTQPGDLVVDLFCQGPTVMREVVAHGRRALGFSVNPLLLVAARLGLGSRDADALNTAFTHLADSPKGGVPLHRHLTSLYASACPTCGAAGTADWFAWDRDGDYPFEKAVRCPACAEVQRGTPDDADVESAGRISPQGLAYYYALDRVAPPGSAGRERAAELVALYTPRNLSALMDLAMRFQRLEADEETRIALAAVLVDCFDACSSLDPHGEERPRPRTLRLPSLYLERNVWQCFEEGFSNLLAQGSPLPARRASDVAALVRGEMEGYALVSHAAREVRKTIQSGSAALIVIDPPRPDAVFLALSALWSGWLWESPAVRRLRPFLRRRRFDWDWHWHVLRVALKAVSPLLVPGGHLLTIFSDPDEMLLVSTCMAAGDAGYVLKEWGYGADTGYRLLWRWEPAKPARADREEWVRHIEVAAAEAVRETLRVRGEPAAWPLLHAGACAELAGRGLLAQAAALPGDAASPLTLVADAIRHSADAIPIARLAGQEGAAGTLWWLSDLEQNRGAAAGHVGPSLADRVEEVVWEVILQQPTWRLEELVRAVYARLPGPLTPDLALVLLCIDSYSVLEGEMLRLRPEDDPLRRTAETRALHQDLEELGRRLGFKVRKKGGWDACWLEEGQEVYVFAISSTAALTGYLLAERAVDEGAHRCLVLPGGRAHLVTFKLQRDPRLSRAVQRERWQFIKFRHLRRLVAKEELDRHALKTVLGLDPIAEQEAAQIPLF